MPCKDEPAGHGTEPEEVRGRDGQQGGARTARAARTEKRTSSATFYRQVVAELRKVVWPTQEQLVTYFIVVMVVRARS